jgi:hypothetical protein
MPITVTELLIGRPSPTSVHFNQTARDAVDLMVEYDYSQIPVVDDNGRPLGMVTSDSILRALRYFGVSLDALRVTDALVDTDEYRAGEDLFDLLDDLRDAYAVLIVDSDRTLTGIVTNYDTTEYFRRRAEDIMLVEDIETMLRNYIRESFKQDDGSVDEETLSEAIKEAMAPRSPEHFDKLTLYNYIELFTLQSRWHRFSSTIKMDVSAVKQLLHSIRSIRNKLAHFRDEITPRQRDELRFCADWLARHQPPSVTSVISPGVTSLSPTPAKTGAESPETTASPQQVDQTIVPPEDAAQEDESRYARLAVWLQARPAEERQTTLTFSQVEEIIDDKLPASARRHYAWWANDTVGHIQSRQWLDAGWRISKVNISEGYVTFSKAEDRERAYVTFFSTLLDELRRVGIPVTYTFASSVSWQTILGMPEDRPYAGYLNFSFTRHRRARAEFYIDAGDQARNKLIFDLLFVRREAIEHELGAKLDWERLDNKRASRIALYRNGVITSSDEQLADLRAWAVDVVGKMHQVFGHHLAEVLEALNTASVTTP